MLTKGNYMAEKEQDKYAGGQLASILKDKANQELRFLFDVPLQISVLLGETEVNIKDLLKMHKGSVLELNKLAGEPLEVLIKNVEVARGEVLVINEHYGLRLTDIIDPLEREEEGKEA